MMSLLKKHQCFVRFVIAGGTAAFVDLVLLYFFTDILGIWYLISACLAFSIAFFVSFFLQKFWAFKDNGKEHIHKQMALYFIIALANLIFNACLMYIFVDIVKIWYLLAQIFASGLIAIESYLIYKFFIFNQISNGRKILIATGIYPPDYRGPATMLEALPKALEQNGFEVKIITYSGIPTSAEEKGKVFRILRDQPGPLRYAKYFFRTLILSCWADIIYVTDIYSVGYFAYLIKKMTGKKYIVRFAGDSAWETSVRSGWTSDYIDDFQRKNYGDTGKIEKLKARRKKIMAGADAVIAVSRFLSDIAQLIGTPKEIIKVIYNSVDFIKDNSRLEEVDEIRKKYGQNAKIIVSAGELNPWKGFDGLTKAMPRLLKELGDVHTLVLGEGQEMENLKNLAQEMKVENNVHFLGKVNHGEIMKYFHAADLFVLNTNYEGLSHTLLEVMRAGAPIVSTRIGGNPETIDSGREGILIAYNNVKELEDAALKILKDPALAQTFVKNATAKLSLFSWSAAVKDTVELLSKTICYYDEK